MPWYKHLVSLDHSIVLTHVYIVVCWGSVPTEVKKPDTENQPNTVNARKLYQLSEMVDDTALGYLMATQDLDALAVKAELKDEGKKKPGPNNLEEASKFVEQINEVVDKFAKTINQYEPYSIQDAYSDFVGRYYELLSKMGDYFVDASPMAVLELVDDTMCKIMCVETEHERKE